MCAPPAYSLRRGTDMAPATLPQRCRCVLPAMSVVLPVAIFAGFAALPLIAIAAAQSYLIDLATRIMIFSIAAVALDLLVGYAGLISFGHAAFIGIGSYAVGILSAHGIADALISLPLALLASALFAGLTGLVCLRTRGVYFIMITLAFGQMAFFIASSLAPYGGDDGLSWPTRTLVFGTRVLKSETVFYYVAFAALGAVYVLMGRLVGSRFGRVLRGLTDNERRMEAIGFAPYPYRLAAYVMAGAAGGLAGFLLGNEVEFVSPAYMHWQRSGELILMVLLGGSGARYGSIVGAMSYVLLEEGLARFTEHWKVILGPLLVGLVLFGRGGIAGIVERWRLGEPSLATVWAASAATARTQGERLMRGLRQADAMAARALEWAVPRSKASAA